MSDQDQRVRGSQVGGGLVDPGDLPVFDRPRLGLANVELSTTVTLGSEPMHRDDVPSP